MQAIDPTVELEGDQLRELIIWCFDWGRTSIGRHDGQDRMAERSFTGGEIMNVLTKGVLSTSGRDHDSWQYSARRNGAEIIFRFDFDDDGNLLVIVTLMRKA